MAQKKSSLFVLPETAATMTLEDTYKGVHYRVRSGPASQGGYKFELMIDGLTYGEDGVSAFGGYPTAFTALCAGREKFGELFRLRG